MNKEDIYAFFKLESQLHMALENWVKKITIDTEFYKVPFEIKCISNDGNGVLHICVNFKQNEVSNQDICYSVIIDDLVEAN